LLHSRTLLFGQVGCGEGGCGACTVQIRFPGQSVPVLANACLRPVCSLDGAGEPHHPTVLCAIRCRVGCLQTDQRTVMPTLHGVCPGPYGRNANGRRLALLEPGRKRCRSGAAVPPLCFRGDDGGGRRDRRTAACIANPARRMRRLAVRILLSWHDHDDGTYLRATPLRAAFLDRSVVASSSLRLGRVVLHTQRRGRRWAGRPVGALPVGLSPAALPDGFGSGHGGVWLLCVRSSACCRAPHRSRPRRRHRRLLGIDRCAWSCGCMLVRAVRAG
jgi:hypothetical protein